MALKMCSVNEVLIVVVAAVASAAPGSDKPLYDVSNAKASLEDLTMKDDRNYKNDADKDADYHAFVKSLERINKLNAESASATFDINTFADYIEVVVAAMASATPASDKPLYDVSIAKGLFEAFVNSFDRNYKDDEDKDADYHAFVEALEQINKLNAESALATFDINKFADYTREEVLVWIENIARVWLEVLQLEKQRK